MRKYNTVTIKIIKAQYENITVFWIFRKTFIRFILTVGKNTKILKSMELLLNHMN